MIQGACFVVANLEVYLKAHVTLVAFSIGFHQFMPKLAGVEVLRYPLLIRHCEHSEAISNSFALWYVHLRYHPDGGCRAAIAARNDNAHIVTSLRAKRSPCEGARFM